MLLEGVVGRVKTFLCRCAFVLFVFLCISRLNFIHDVYFPPFYCTAYEYIFFFFLQVHDISFSSVSLVSKIDFPNSLSQRSKPLSESENQNAAYADLGEKK